MKRIVFATFILGDVEDPEIYIAAPIYDWQQTDYGKWCKENCEPNSICYGISVNCETYGYRCTIYGELTEHLHTFHRLKWSDHVSFNS